MKLPLLTAGLFAVSLGLAGVQTTPAQAQSSPLNSPDVIREVQEALYNLNYKVKKRDGRMSNELRQAIQAWQRIVKHPDTGEMTDDELAQLRTADPIKVWGGVGFNAKGQHVEVINVSSRAQAESEVMARCRRIGAKGCDPFTFIQTQCVALAKYEGTLGRRRHWGTYVVRRGSTTQATEDVMTDCRNQAKVPSTCRLLAGPICADGHS
jgi:hypothetical protein